MCHYDMISAAFVMLLFLLQYFSSHCLPFSTSICYLFVVFVLFL